MALVTRCPDCATLFKVVPDQLRISEGWVRCGHCNVVFDASVDLHQQPTEALTAMPLSPPSMSPAEPPTPEPAPSSSSVEASEPWLASPRLALPEPPQLSQRAAEPVREADGVAAQSEFSAGGDDLMDAGRPDDVISAEAAMEAEFDRELHAIEAEAQEQVERTDATTGVATPDDTLGEFSKNAAIEADEADEIEETEDTEYDWRDAVDSADADDSDSVEPSVPDMPAMAEDAVFVAPMVSTAVDTTTASSDELMAATAQSAQVVMAPLATTPAPSSSASSVDDYSFLSNASKQRSVWQKPGVRYGLMGLTAVLLLLLAGQWLVAQRELVAAHWPQSRPLLVSMCAPLGCTVSPLRRIDAIAIDSSGFTATRRGAYRLNVVLKNHGVYALAVPAVELALTDTQEQAVIRRVIQPHELGIAAEVIEARSELAAVVDLAVPENDTAGRIVGYRLLAFYP